MNLKQRCKYFISLESNRNAFHVSKATHSSVEGCLAIFPWNQSSLPSGSFVLEWRKRDFQKLNIICSKRNAQRFNISMVSHKNEFIFRFDSFSAHFISFFLLSSIVFNCMMSEHPKFISISIEEKKCMTYSARSS